MTRAVLWRSSLSVALLLLLGSAVLQALNPAVVTKPDDGSTATAISVRDYLGRSVQLSAPARRIVALSPHIVENLFSAGLGDRIVATVNYADYPAAAKDIPRIGGFSHFSREAILQYQPDLVIGWAAGYQGFAGLLEQLEALGIP
ncbi:MAG: ABC transporter substrate-binding protein, partial [Pseudomonadales bacterium]|nr:ABC transporter substrate-binding protein [Pseudomonadales bacterium]